jgi:hypothetical protein
MKKLIIALLFFAASFRASAQLQDNFAGYADMGSVSGAGPTYVFTVANFFGDQKPHDDTWVIGDLVAGDVIWGGECSRFVVVSRSGLAVTVTDPLPGVSVIPANNSRIAFRREIDVNGFKVSQPGQNGDGNSGAIVGITAALAACMDAHYTENMTMAVAAKLTGNAAITPNTFTKITYDSKGLVLSGTNATAGDIINTPSGSISAITVQAAIDELATEKASTAIATTTTNGLFPSYNSLETVTATTSQQAKLAATTGAGLPFIWVDAAGSKHIEIK